MNIPAPRRRPSTVPYIAAWSDEAVEAPSILFGGLGGIRYAGETPADRDDRRLLLQRRLDRPGAGRPQYGIVHTGRQFRAMQELLCQVCSEPADQDDRGTLWLLDDNRADWSGWPNDLLTTYPPVCLPCARLAAEVCPHLAGGSLAVRVGSSDICAAYGQQYLAGPICPLPAAVGVVPLDAPAIRWTVASQLVRGLSDCTIVDLQAELAACP